MKKTIISLLMPLVINVSGHELWIQPDKFIYKRTETINLRFFTGEKFTGHTWNASKDDVDVFRLFFDDVSDKNLDNNLSKRDGDSLQIVMLDEGTVVLSLQTKNSFRDVKAEDFNEYLQQNGLTDILDYRKKNGDTIKAGLENYQHNAKTILQVGHRTNNIYKQKTGLPIDMIPSEHPYTVSKDGNFKVKVFFWNQILKNAKVTVSHRVGSKISQLELTTDNDGEVKFFLSPQGEWMVSCVKMVRLENDLKAEWQSYQGTLTWGYTK
jgi:uncharacterized GH25 family protein